MNKVYRAGSISTQALEIFPTFRAVVFLFFLQE